MYLTKLFLLFLANLKPVKLILIKIIVYFADNWIVMSVFKEITSWTNVNIR